MKVLLMFAALALVSPLAQAATLCGVLTQDWDGLYSLETGAGSVGLFPNSSDRELSAAVNSFTCVNGSWDRQFFSVSSVSRN